MRNITKLSYKKSNGFMAELYHLNNSTQHTCVVDNNGTDSHTSSEMHLETALCTAFTSAK